MCKKKKSNWLKIFTLTLVGLGAGIIILFFCIAPFNDWSGEPNATLFGQYGDFIGGFVGSLFSLAGFILLYLTLNAQQVALQKQEEEIKAQKRISEFESFETTFFNLINIQHSIANNIKASFSFINREYDVKTITVTGYEFFNWAIKIRNLINLSLSQNSYVGKYDNKNNQNAIQQFDEMFNPQSPNYEPFLDYDNEKSRFVKYQNIEFVNSVFNITKEKWEEGRATEGVARVEFVYNLFFSEYHYAIGHYFRNMYHILKFISRFEEAQTQYQKTLEDIDNLKDKCNQYAQFIQAQLSARELAILHDNAICFPNMSDYIAKYKLLENAPTDYLINKINYL